MTEPAERVHRSIRKMLFYNFLGGIAWGLGVTIGLSVVLTILGFALTQINLVPIVGDFTSQVMEFVNTEKPNPLNHN